MIIRSAEILTSAAKFNQLPPEDKLEIVLIGKSNVGKSSFINNLLNRKSLARTSSVPGKTRTANYYIINNEFYIVDMPGYGYAKVSKSEKATFSNIITDYLKKRNADFIVFFLVDIRHKPSENDVKMYNEILDNDIYPVVVLTKADKISKNKRKQNTDLIKKTLGLDEDDKVIIYSTEEKLGRDEVWDFIEEFI
ncbi:ribosome biogenesis GTP-binding protein YihA/YsxC [Anaerofustis stercorihominis]|uniref:ribosome biogenesis GTP-binding protein YihA/YsxC n=1 Tax=Anaerofustis stercorihominis TaxID=214853 RepID=UPI00214A98F4|nr:ribosome biogenesis GTP-binding protein YihA/YsxC [Anaerofustis stercorihominis]MCR2033731.1 ribosome biogenesis GTP-binding protein YihA/YsxC [Anaerofustis stercorihominis]